MLQREGSEGGKNNFAAGHEYSWQMTGKLTCSLSLWTSASQLNIFAIKSEDCPQQILSEVGMIWSCSLLLKIEVVVDSLVCLLAVPTETLVPFPLQGEEFLDVNLQTVLLWDDREVGNGPVLMRELPDQVRVVSPAGHSDYSASCTVRAEKKGRSIAASGKQRVSAPDTQQIIYLVYVMETINLVHFRFY